MASLATRVLLGAAGSLLALLLVVPAYADPFFLRVYGRTYKVDPRYASNEPKGPKPQEVMRALPSDLAKGPGFRPSHEQVLAEVEERLWIARHQLDDEMEKAAASPEWRNTGADANAIKQQITGALAAGTPQSRSPELQKLFDRHRALNLLVRELRQSMDLPVRPAGAEFSRPKLSPELEASYRSLNFDPLEAYYGFRRVKAALRSGDPRLLARVVHYPLAVMGKVRRTIRNRDQLLAAREVVMDPRIREIVATSAFETAFVRDRGIMLGEGEVWLTSDKIGFGLGSLTLQ
jgi:hypothetical protein